MAIWILLALFVGIGLGILLSESVERDRKHNITTARLRRLANRRRRQESK